MEGDTISADIPVKTAVLDTFGEVLRLYGNPAI